MQSQMRGHGGGGDRSSGSWRSPPAWLVLAILALIAWSTTKEAWPAFTEEGSPSSRRTTGTRRPGQFGALAFIYGTLLSSFIALLFAVPVSLGIALFTNEAAPRRLRKPSST